MISGDVISWERLRKEELIMHFFNILLLRWIEILVGVLYCFPMVYYFVMKNMSCAKN